MGSIYSQQIHPDFGIAVRAGQRQPEPARPETRQDGQTDKTPPPRPAPDTRLTLQTPLNAQNFRKVLSDRPNDRPNHLLTHLVWAPSYVVADPRALGLFTRTDRPQYAV